MSVSNAVIFMEELLGQIPSIWMNVRFEGAKETVPNI